MAQLSRRHFLQTAGAAFTAVGLHPLLQRQRAVLAQPTGRKLALLVGINDYADSPLYGCVNDAILQRQLLMRRFGFNPKDIVMLLDGQATRQGMLDAFEEHLIKQSKPGDVVAFHYSGHGSLVLDPDPIFVSREGQGLNGTFVPIDSKLPSDYPVEGGTVNDIMGHTLFLLMSAIQTDYFTAVLDSCFSGAATRKIRVRARDGGPKIEVAPQEKAYQDQWLTKLGWSPQELIDRYRQGVANGVVLASTQRNQFAIDEQLNGFVAGAFTYRFTQHLWQTDPSPAEAIAHVNRKLPADYNQQALWEAKIATNNGNKPIFFIEDISPTADAIVLERDRDEATILLVGIDPGNVTLGQVFQDNAGRGQIHITNRQGLIATGMVKGDLSVNDHLKQDH